MTTKVEPDSEMGARLRTAREACGLSQMRLGAAINRTHQSVMAWEQARRPVLALDLIAIGEACGVRPEWLLTGSGRMRVSK